VESKAWFVVHYLTPGLGYKEVSESQEVVVVDVAGPAFLIRVPGLKIVTHEIAI